MLFYAKKLLLIQRRLGLHVFRNSTINLIIKINQLCQKSSSRQGIDCLDPDAMDGGRRTPPCGLNSGNPFRKDGVAEASLLSELYIWQECRIFFHGLPKHNRRISD
jgi:hypothetical protein